MNSLVNSIALVTVLVAAVTDIRTRRIPNQLTLPMMVLGLVLNTLGSGSGGFLSSLGGMAVGFALLFPVYLLGGMGAGDVKLLSAVGALLGARQVFNSFIWSALAGGLMALIYMVVNRAFSQTFRNLRLLIQGWILGVDRSEANLTIRNQSLIKLPYGVAIAVGTTLAVWLQRIPGLNF